MLLRCIAGLLAGASVFASYAQDDAVIVTATRFPDAKRDLPVGVTVITAEDMRKSASSNLGEILAQFGLLNIRDLAGAQNQQLDLRGFGITGDQNTLVLLDGLRISENELESAQLSAIPIESIERIEIVRGGGAVLYGGGATGGTINIITRKGSPGERRAHALLRVGGYGTEEARAGFDRYGRTFGGGLTASYEDTEGYRRNSRYRQRSALGRMEAGLPEGRAYVKLGVDDQRQRLPGRLTEAEMIQDPRQTKTPQDWRERDGMHLTVGGNRLIGRHELGADLGYRTKRSRFAAVSIFGAFTGETEVDHWLFTPRAKMGFGRHDLIVGSDLEAWDYGSASHFNGVPSARVASEQTNAALYAQTNLWVAERTRVVLGARHQRLAQRLAVEATGPRTDTRRLEAYEAAVRQRLAGGWSGYAKYANSFRVATFDENNCFFPPCGDFLRPQKARGAELGVEFESTRLRTRASAYQTDLEDEIYFSPLVPPFGANINLSPTRRRGLEVESFWQATPNLDVRAGLALTQATFRSGVYGGVDVTGKTVPLVPEVLATVGASWRFTPRSRFSLNARHVGAQRFDNDQANTFRREMPEYTLVDVKVEQRLARRWELALEVRNLFDRRYFSYGAVNPADANDFVALPAPERAAYLSVAWRLD